MNNNEKKILLLGVGNLLYKDEGVGVHVARILEEKYVFSPNVTLLEGGTLGKLLMPHLVECDLAIIMDTARCGHEAGTIYRLVDDDLRKSLGFCDSQHQVDLVDILISCELMGQRPEAVIIAIEPEDMHTLDMELTETVKQKLEKFISHVLDEVQDAGGCFHLKS